MAVDSPRPSFVVTPSGLGGEVDSPPSFLGPSIDWLVLSQYQPEAPEFGAEIVQSFDPDSGEVVYRTRKGVSVEGSYSSTARVRSFGGWVSLSFNPSRWNRLHSLDGCRSVAEGLAVANEVLAGVGLPAFYEWCDPEASRVARRSWTRKGPVCPDQGVSLSRVDVCEVYECGSMDDARAFLLAASQFSGRGQRSRVYGELESVTWFDGSRLWYVKLYLKGPEMRKHGGPELVDVAEWACSVGLARFEVEVKRPQLLNLGLERPSAWSSDAMRKILDGRSFFKGAGVGRSSLLDIQVELERLGVPRRRAGRCQQAAVAYASGVDLRAAMGRSAWYEVRAELLKVGLDISAPSNVVALSPKVRTIELRPVVLPERFRGGMVRKAL